MNVCGSKPPVWSFVTAAAGNPCKAVFLGGLAGGRGMITRRRLALRGRRAAFSVSVWETGRSSSLPSGLRSRAINQSRARGPMRGHGLPRQRLLLNLETREKPAKRGNS